MNTLPLPPGSIPIEPGPDYFQWFVVAVIIAGIVYAIRQFSFWHWFQFLTMMAVIGGLAWIAVSTGAPIPQSTALFIGVAVAYGVTVGVNWLLTHLRERRLPNE